MADILIEKISKAKKKIYSLRDIDKLNDELISSLYKENIFSEVETREAKEREFLNASLRKILENEVRQRKEYFQRMEKFKEPKS